ncbi:FAD-dependent oxidoreductase [Marinomonas sp. 15G1-11]|uniref:FAD-dependent oxidoreductase n=1 Tax=Marinomonas phaeophyticola TaxID=3004091 RepID=A0ABT4JS82_9GAMM|nr:FAD-dependent oxidoreductase [Marinomonas sp. 15G1-11]MCZ2720887.1 FAD-dependent oxidoreductase [Marinomonas sp. 15G1-11]
MTGKQAATHTKTNVAIIGAGIAGSFCASLLSSAGIKVTVLEKSRGTGGRSSSKKIDDHQSVDLGAPFFHLSSPLLKEHSQEWLQKHIIMAWPEVNKTGLFAYVGTPKMSSLTRYLIGEAELINNCYVHHIEKSNHGWILRNENDQIILECDQLIITTPAAQTCSLLASTHSFPKLLSESHWASALCRPQWSIMIKSTSNTEQSRHVDSPLIEPKNHPVIERIIHDSAKPGRSGSSSNWVIQAKKEWSEKNIEANKTFIAVSLSNAFFEITGQKGNSVICHRWLLGQHTPLEGEPSRWVPKQNLGIAADWLCQGDIEGALLSAQHLCNRILHSQHKRSTVTQGDNHEL